MELWSLFSSKTFVIPKQLADIKDINCEMFIKTRPTDWNDKYSYNEVSHINEYSVGIFVSDGLIDCHQYVADLVFLLEETWRFGRILFIVHPKDFLPRVQKETIEPQFHFPM